MGNTLFKHLDAIKKDKDSDYWDTLTKDEKRKWNTYMINRFMSMNYDYVPIVNVLQRYTMNMPDKAVYRLYAEIFPYDTNYYKYVKSQTDEYPEWMLEKLSTYYRVSKSEAKEYIDTYLQMEDGRKELKRILRKYGIEDDKLNKVDELSYE